MNSPERENLNPILKDDQPLLLAPDFQEATLQDIKDILSLLNIQIAIVDGDADPVWLEKINCLERKGVLKVLK